MSTLDWVLLGIVIASAVFGLMRGFVGAVVSLVSWALSGWVAFRFGGDVANVLAGAAPPGASQLLGGYAICFLGVLVVVGLVGWVMRWLLKSVGLSSLDRAMGLALGLVRGGFVACVLVLLLGLTPIPRDPDWHASAVVPLFVPGARALTGWLPPWVAAQVDFGAGGAMPERQDLPLALPAPLGT